MTPTSMASISILSAFLLSGQPALSQPRDNVISSARDQCERYGFQPGSDGFARCVQESVEREKQLAANEEDRKKAIRLCESQMWFDPSGGGTLGGALANVAKCSSDPQAYLRQRQNRGFTCQRDLLGNVSCVPIPNQ